MTEPSIESQLQGWKDRALNLEDDLRDCRATLQLEREARERAEQEAETDEMSVRRKTRALVELCGKHRSRAEAAEERAEKAERDAKWQAEEREREMDRYDELHKELDRAVAQAGELRAQLVAAQGWMSKAVEFVAAVGQDEESEHSADDLVVEHMGLWKNVSRALSSGSGAGVAAVIRAARALVQNGFKEYASGDPDAANLITELAAAVDALDSSGERAVHADEPMGADRALDEGQREPKKSRSGPPAPPHPSPGPPCGACDGKGWVNPGPLGHTCWTCGGTGKRPGPDSREGG